MKKDCIQDFIEAWETYDNKILTYSEKMRRNWNIRFREAGYYSVDHHYTGTRKLDFDKWNEMHEWCRKTVGSEHYAWSGEIFWFETEQAAVWFALRWS